MARTPEIELTKKLQAALKLIHVGGTYSHYKNPKFKYIVTAIGLNEATEEINIVYQAQYGQKLTWVRTLENYTEEIDVKGSKVKRFQKL